MTHGISNRRTQIGRLSLFFVLALLLGRSDGHAEGVTIKGDDPAKSIEVSVDNATVRDVLAALRDKYGVELAGDGEAGASDPMTVTLQGSLPTILERLLRNQNYMIVRSKKNVTGVEKVLIAVPDGSKESKTSPAQPPEPTPMP
jgi:hypothetical protein